MKKDLRLTYEDRCQIHALWKRGLSHAEIAWNLAVHRTTIWRELRRNCMPTGYARALYCLSLIEVAD